jgi:GTP-binding protein YchF
MEIALVGMPNSGKTTLLHALTRGRFESHKAGLQTGVVKAPDSRLKALAGLFSPEKIVPAEVTYWDLAAPSEGPSAGTGGGGISGQIVNQLQKADALVHVVRAFADDSVPYHQPTIDPIRDADAMDAELIFCDLGILERRRQRVDTNLKGARGQERSTFLREISFIEKLQKALEDETPVSRMELSGEEQAMVTGYNMLTGKRVLTVFNVGEEVPEIAEEGDAFEHRPGALSTSICAKLEQELGQLSPEDEQEFRESMGLPESGWERVVGLSHKLLDMASFFTVGPDEVRAWTVPQNIAAVKAASKIHSDIERGFIRAEVIDFDQLMACGSLVQAKKQGVLRLEGKGYPVQDGDVITFLFNV